MQVRQKALEVNSAEYQKVSNMSLPNNSTEGKTTPVKLPAPTAEESPHIKLYFTFAEQTAAAARGAKGSPGCSGTSALPGRAAAAEPGQRDPPLRLRRAPAHLGLRGSSPGATGPAPLTVTPRKGPAPAGAELRWPGFTSVSLAERRNWSWRRDVTLELFFTSNTFKQAVHQYRCSQPCSTAQ